MTPTPPRRSRGGLAALLPVLLLVAVLGAGAGASGGRAPGRAPLVEITVQHDGR